MRALNVSNKKDCWPWLIQLAVGTIISDRIGIVQLLEVGAGLSQIQGRIGTRYHSYRDVRVQCNT